MNLSNRHSESGHHGWPRGLLALSLFLLPVVLALTAAAQTAQSSPSTGTPQPAAAPKKPRKTHKPRELHPETTPPPSTPAPSQPDSHALAQPASVTLSDGKLTIKAYNSDLDQILREVSRLSGMVIEGSVVDDRVYGSYGPRSPREILTELLAGTGYNVMMFGAARDGVPARLMLTTRTGGPTPASVVRAQAHHEDSEPGPGAIAHAPPPPTDDPQLRVQQNLQRLQQMHDAQDEQQKQKTP
jgi:hypothetical protein